MRRRKWSSTAGWLGWIFGLGLAVAGPEACATRDCSEEREGTVRCVGNQLERCVDGDVLYEPCMPRGLVCSEADEGCVTQDDLDQGAGGATGAGGASGGSGGLGGDDDG